MDSEPGSCWRCGEPAQGMCPQCQMALYCSNTCLQDDRASHLVSWCTGRIGRSIFIRMRVPEIRRIPLQGGNKHK